MDYGLFQGLIVAHVLTGSTAALTIFVPLIGRKGGTRHRGFGRVFTVAALATGCFAIAMSLLTLQNPQGVHPHLEGRFEDSFIAGIFGWMMLHNGLLTVNLAWYGWECARNKSMHVRNRSFPNHAMQYLLLLAAVGCAWQGWLINQPLMIGISIVGVATGITNLIFIYTEKPAPMAWKKEHLKALVGVGISVYTAFLAFGSLRVMPSLALNPVLWAVPLGSGIAIILYHWQDIARKMRQSGAGRIPVKSMVLPNAGEPHGG